MRGLAVFIICILIAVGTTGCTESDGGGDSNGAINAELEFNVTTNTDTGDYELYIYMSSSMIISTKYDTEDLTGMDHIWFEILTDEGEVATVIDPNGNEIKGEGRFTDILFDQTEFNNANNSDWPNSTHGAHFHADHPSGSNNISLYMAYLDDSNEEEDERFHVDSGDTIWIRSSSNDGFAMEGYSLRITCRRFDDPIVALNVKLPAIV